MSKSLSKNKVSLVSKKKGMNVLVYKLSIDKLCATPEKSFLNIIVEDNVGEGIHIHWHNFRIEMSIKDFKKFSQKLKMIKENFIWE